MRIIDCEQGSQEWIRARLGIPTASQFHKIMTPKTMKPSSQADGYMHRLLAEWVLGEPLDDTTNEWMQRGTLLEDEAVSWYEFQNDVRVQSVGFCMLDELDVGCSPDRLVGTEGGLEIKVPGPHTHIGYLLNGPDTDYRCQVQGSLWITGRKWWDFLSYHPDMPRVLIRFERDDTFIDALALHVGEFYARLEAAKRKLIEKGCAPALAA